MPTRLLLFWLAALYAFPAAAKGFLDQQLANPHVHAVYDRASKELRKAFAEQDVPFPPHAILLRAFKREARVELWAEARGGEYKQVKSYRICAGSGTLGPKVEEGDGQVPEGFYSVSVFNPWSQFHLSLGVSYPNAADIVRSAGRRPGGSIMIHGNCVTIGCIPLTDPMIDEVYVAAVLARDAGQERIPIHIFPTRLDEEGWRSLQAASGASPSLLAFWSELRPAFEAFERTHRPPDIRISREGHYVLTRQH